MENKIKDKEKWISDHIDSQDSMVGTRTRSVWENNKLVDKEITTTQEEVDKYKEYMRKLFLSLDELGGNIKDNKLNEKIKPEWEIEPDELHFVDEKTGYKCVIWRHPELGNLNGYVILPKDTKLYKLYKESDEYWFYNSPILVNNIKVHGDIKVHGGLTYSGDCLPYLKGEFALGFDCGHGFDLIPYLDYGRSSSDLSNATYKNIEYVKKECSKLASQLYELNEEIMSEKTREPLKYNGNIQKRFKVILSCVMDDRGSNIVFDLTTKEGLESLAPYVESVVIDDLTYK